jgi:hypothetical protein
LSETFTARCTRSGSKTTQSAFCNGGCAAAGHAPSSVQRSKGKRIVAGHLD